MGDDIKLERLRLETTNSSIQRHDAFYLEDVYFVVSRYQISNITTSDSFQFDNLIFKFPKLYLQDSPTFQQLFSNIEDTEFTGKGTSLKPYSCRGV